ncbi:MAG TPA: hypothetical protein GXX41_13845 [Thermoanaerobacterium sp.]|nr:hypothetical protein [Thermoanaerobacterium sp.]
MGAVVGLLQIKIAESAIHLFEMLHEDFMRDLKKILIKYKDYSFKYKKFSLVYRDLFRAMLEREKYGIYSSPDFFNGIQKDIRVLKRKHNKDFLEFKELVRNCDIRIQQCCKDYYG